MRVLVASVLLSSIVFAALVPVPALRADDAAAPAPSLPSWKKGEQEGVVKIDGQDEKFVALVPNGYSPKKPCPAVLLLHGNGGKAADFLQVVKTFVGKTPPLLIALERCDNQQKAEGYAPKYLEAPAQAVRDRGGEALRVRVLRAAASASGTTSCASPIRSGCSAGSSSWGPRARASTRPTSPRPRRR